MAKVKDILKHVGVEIAGRRRKCYRRKGHLILKGEACLVVRDGPQKQTTYCMICATEILEKADRSLAALHGRFGLTRPDDKN